MAGQTIDQENFHLNNEPYDHCPYASKAIVPTISSDMIAFERVAVGREPQVFSETRLLASVHIGSVAVAQTISLESLLSGA